MVCGARAADVRESEKDCSSPVLVSKAMDVGGISRVDSDAEIFELPLAWLGIDCDSDAVSRGMEDPIADVSFAGRVSSPASGD